MYLQLAVVKGDCLAYLCVAASEYTSLFASGVLVSCFVFLLVSVVTLIGVSECIIMGMPARIGTGLFSLVQM